MEAVAIPLLLVVGALLTLQAAANVQLSTAIGSPLGASTLQLSIGAALLLAVAAAAGTVTRLEGVDEAPAWHLAGGLGSALYITAGILLFPRLGALLAVGLFVAGQMGASLLLDATGWLGVPQDEPDPAAVAGAVAVVAAIALLVRAQGGAPAGPARWVALGLAAGAALPVQGAVNAQLRADLDAPTTAGAFSFMVATAAMAAVLLAALAARRTPRPRVVPLARLPWWGWLGGGVGAAYVIAVFMLLPEIGAAPTIALTVAGHQLASVLVDRFGLLRLPGRTITRGRLAGVALLLAGVALIQVPGA